jgi:hypothetical protein
MSLKSLRNAITTSADAAMLGRIADSAYDLQPIVCQMEKRTVYPGLAEEIEKYSDLVM